MPVSAAIVRAIVEQLERSDVSADAFYDKVGIAPASLQDPTTPIDRDVFISCIEAGVTLSGDPAFALHVGEQARASALHVVGHLMMNGVSIRQAIDAFLRFAPLVAEGPRFKFVEEPHVGRFVAEFPTLPSDGQRWAAELALAFVLQVGRALLGPRYFEGFHEARFAHSPPTYVREVRRVFGPGVRFRQPRSELVFDRALLDQRCLHGDTPVFDALWDRASQLLHTQGEQQLPHRVRELLLFEPELLREGSEVVARRLGHSARTLRRRLKDHGASYSTIADEVRQQLALKALSDPRASVKEVAHRVGFSEPSAFCRAFKRWTGTTPQQHRDSSVPPPPLMVAGMEKYLS